MQLVLFPAMVGASVLAGSLILAALEACVFDAGGKLGCRSSLDLAVAMASVGAVLAAIMAGQARALLARLLSFETRLPDLFAAALTGLLLVLLSHGLIYWDVEIGGMAGVFFGWLLSSFLVSAVALLVVKGLLSEA